MKMMLSKAYQENKVKFPCYVSQKLDGVPVIFWLENGELKHATRQGKQLESIPHIIKNVKELVDTSNLTEGFVCCGELYIKDMPFKDISGKVRKQLPCKDLKLYIFELSKEINFLQYIATVSSLWDMPCYINQIRQEKVNNQEELQSHLDMLNVTDEDWEGLIIRSGEYEHGKRSWNSMKYKIEPTADLKVVGIEEAISKEGEPLGRVGAFLCEYKDSIIKVGSGKLSHAESKILWDEELLQYGRIIEVKYMKDDSYEALRQPTFQCFRDDKDEPNWDE